MDGAVRCVHNWLGPVHPCRCVDTVEKRDVVTWSAVTPSYANAAFRGAHDNAAALRHRVIDDVTNFERGKLFEVHHSTITRNVGMYSNSHHGEPNTNTAITGPVASSTISK